jgi:hypothetical protein
MAAAHQKGEHSLRGSRLEAVERHAARRGIRYQGQSMPMKRGAYQQLMVLTREVRCLAEAFGVQCMGRTSFH